MESLDNAYRFKRAGRFSHALTALGDARATQASGRAADVLRVELLEAIGQHTNATLLARSLLRTKQLNSADKSACEFILGKILVDEGDVVAGMDHLQRSASLARDAKTLDRLFAAQLKLELDPVWWTSSEGRIRCPEWDHTKRDGERVDSSQTSLWPVPSDSCWMRGRRSARSRVISI